MNEQLNLFSIVDIILRRWTVIIMITIVAGIFSFVYSEVFIEPTYESTASLYVNSSKEIDTNQISQSDINSSRQLVMTYSEILKSRTFLSKIANDLYGEYTIEKLKSMIKIDSLNQTEILSVSVKGKDADDVFRIVRSIVRYAPDELIRVFEAGMVKIVDDAEKNDTPVSPNIRNNTFIGIFLGLVLGIIIILVLELFDTRIKFGEEITKRYEEPLLGEIPRFVAHVENTNDAEVKK